MSNELTIPRTGTSILKQLIEKTAVAKLPPPRECEYCHKVVPVGHDAINFMITVGSPGHPDLPPFQCPAEEHWACSIECWAIVAHACIDEHISLILHTLHDYMNEKGNMLP